MNNPYAAPAPTLAPVTRQWWDDQAVTVDSAQRACWSEPGESWTPGIERCLPEILPTASIVAHWHHPRLLDLGCGVGRLTFPVARFMDARGSAAEVIGIDLSPNMIEHAEHRRRYEGVGNVLFVVGNGDSLPNAIQPLAFVWSVLLFQHCVPVTVRGYIAEVARLLEKGGAFRFQFVEGEDRSQPLSQGYSENEMVGWCKEAGLDVPVVDRGRVYDVWTWLTAVRP